MKEEQQQYCINVLALIVLTIGIIAVFGIAMDIEWMFKWSKTSMALNTAINFSLIGFIILILNNKER